MHVVITGGAGFLGRRLTSRLLQRGRLAGPDGREINIDRITLIDVVPASGLSDSRVTQIAGDVADPDLARRVMDDEVLSVFHLAAIVSGMAEADFDLGMRINLDASRVLLDACRIAGHRPRVVFASSVAVYGGPLPDVVQDTTAVNPQSSYGTQKAIVELLINDYSRKGFIDGRVLRLPTISVRPGRPNAAASSFASGIIREPINGESSVCPVDPDTRLWLLSPATAIECLIVGHDVGADRLGLSRIVNLPGLSITPGEMVRALERAAGAEVAARVQWARDPRIERIVATWPGAWDTTRARALGFPADQEFDAIVRRFIDEVTTK